VTGETTGDATGARGLPEHPDGRRRCWWCGTDPGYVEYHDREWGRPVEDDVRLFEKLSLEAFQSGLSWLTILRKRPAFREAFAGFEPAAVARFGRLDVERLLGDAGIVRHRGKIEAVIGNAARAIELIEERGSLAAWAWSFEPDDHVRPRGRGDVASTHDASRAMAADLRRRGWRFVGPTTAYAFMQAMGIVNDHFVGCPAGDAVDAERAAFRRPGRAG